MATKTYTSSRSTLRKADAEEKKRQGYFDSAMTTIAPASGAMDQFLSPTGMNTWKRNQTQQRTSATNKAFDNSGASTSRRALMSGFGYDQPISNTAMQSNDIGRAEALSQIPGQVETESIPLTMQAAGLKNQFANTQAGMGSAYDPQGYYKTAVSQDQAALDREEAAKQRRAQLWGSIIGGVSSIATGGLSSYLGRSK